MNSLLQHAANEVEPEDFRREFQVDEDELLGMTDTLSDVFIAEMRENMQERGMEPMQAVMMSLAGCICTAFEIGVRHEHARKS